MSRATAHRSAFSKTVTCARWQRRHNWELGRREDSLSNRKKKDRDNVAPQLTAPDKRPVIGGLYSAKLLFEFCVFVQGVPSDRRLCEERLILLAATSAREA